MVGNVLVTRPIPREGIQLLVGAGCAVEMRPQDRPLSRAELLAAVRGRDGVLCLLHDVIDREVFDAADQVRVFANYAVGYNNIDVAEATRRGVAVTNTPGVLTEATADLAFALLLAAARRICEGDRVMRSGAWEGWGPMQFHGVDVAGRILGICGAGRIGEAVARRGAGFGMKLLYYSRSAKPDWERQYGARRVEKPTLLAESDFISVHLPLTAQTRHFFDEAAFRAMKPTAVFVNTARGPIHDERALVRALREGWIRAAGLDVYENEPAMAEGLAQCENAVLAPHIGSATTATRAKMATMAATNLLAVLRGERPPNLVNPEIYKVDKDGSLR